MAYGLCIRNINSIIPDMDLTYGRLSDNQDRRKHNTEAWVSFHDCPTEAVDVAL